MKLSLAIERYDRHIPFYDGTVEVPDRIELDVYQVGQSVTLRDGTNRHDRVLGGEFDIGEFSMSKLPDGQGPRHADLRHPGLSPPPVQPEPDVGASRFRPLGIRRIWSARRSR